MKLLLDIGNSRIKWALADAQGLRAQHAVNHAELAAELKKIEASAQQKITRVLVSNVAGAELANRIGELTRQRWNITPEFAATVAQHGEVTNAYATPATLGVDRWLALLGAQAMNATQLLQAQALLIVDIGTAMTLDALDISGGHLGGLIVPGPQLMMNSLMRNTSDIATFSQQGQTGSAFFADTTLGCVYQGAVQSIVAIIERAFVRLSVETNSVPQVLMTGGDSERILPLLSMPVKPVPDLVLRGLLVALP